MLLCCVLSYECTPSVYKLLLSTTGPSSWGKKYPDACGQHQSPINLKDGRLDPGLLATPLQTEFASVSGFLACNTGVTAKFKPTDRTPVSCKGMGLCL